MGWVKLHCLTHSQRNAMVVTEIDGNRPLIVMLHNEKTGLIHDVVLDAYRQPSPEENVTYFEVHLNMGHTGRDNGWYNIDQPVCIRHHHNGELAANGTCAQLFTEVRSMTALRPQE